jgi:AcrR family transcriptional regulator
MGRRSNKEEQQKKIIETFYEIAKQEGIENTSFGKVAKELNMHQSHVIHYFSSKDELIFGLIEYILLRYGEIFETDAAGINSLEKLKKVMNNIFSRKWDNYIDDSIFYNCFALVFRNAKVKERFRDLHIALRTWLQNLIQNCIDQKLIDCPDAAVAADIIFVISDGAYYYLSMIEDSDTCDMHLKRYQAEAVKLLGYKSVQVEM